MLWIVGIVVIIAIASTTARSRSEAARRLARWNPLFIALIIAGLALIFYPWPPAGR
jgi:hypothetical protein